MMAEDDISRTIRALRGPILVTGASGFVGSNLVLQILKYRSDIFACTSSGKGWRLESLSDNNVYITDLNDFSAVKSMMSALQPKTVFHCAAYGAYSFEKDAQLIYKTNFSSLVNFVEECSSRGVSAFIHAGSSSEYGANSAAPGEDSNCDPDSSYSISKIAASKYLRYMGKTKDFPCVNLRLYSVYGPLEDTSRLIPTTLSMALKSSYPPFVDPGISRDFVHVDDVCRAFFLAASNIRPEIYGEDINIGTGVCTTVKDLAELVKRVFYIKEDPVFGEMPARSWDRSEWYSNPTKAFSVLGWRSEYSLEDGLRKTASWVGQLGGEGFDKSSKARVVNRNRSISAIIACYRDEQAIPIMHERLTKVFKKIEVDYEIIFVNDCSPDNSAEVIRKLSENDLNVVGVSHSRNFGSQMAFRSGMEVSTKQSVVLLDGDLQDPPELIEQFFVEWLKGSDVVYGRRVKRDMPWYWSLQYRLFYKLFAKFSYVPVPRDAGDFSLMDRRVVDWILQCPEGDLFLRGLRAYVGFQQVGVDYVRPERMFGTSTNNFLKNLDWAKKGIFSFSNTPLAMLTALGVGLFSVSLLLAFVIAGLRILFPDIAPKGITTLLISVLLLGSLNLAAIGIVGEYIGKILIEVKGRPRLIRAAMIRGGRTVDIVPAGKVGPS